MVLAVLSRPTPALAIPGHIDRDLVFSVASASNPNARAQAYDRFLKALSTENLSVDAKLNGAWAAYHLTSDDFDRGRLLAIIAEIPDSRARMLIGSFREFPALRQQYAAADRINSEILNKLRPPPTPPVEGKRQPLREIFGDNPFDSPYLYDRWIDSDGFSGRWSDGSVTLDVVAWPGDSFVAVSNPVSKGRALRLIGLRSESGLALRGAGTSGTISADGFALTIDGAGRQLKRIPSGKTSFASRPKDAIVLLDADTGLRHFRQSNGAPAAWQVLPDGAIQTDQSSGSIFTRDAWGDIRGYFEFRHAFNKDCAGPRRGNSGIYIFNSYEVQLIDSFGQPPDETSEGSVYHIAVPKVTASAAPLEWQSMEFEFRAPRFDKAGKKTANARLTFWHNGIKIHDDVEIPHATGGSPAGGREMRDPQSPQGFMLQNHGGILQFRNIWVLPLGPLG